LTERFDAKPHLICPIIIDEHPTTGHEIYKIGALISQKRMLFFVLEGLGELKKINLCLR